MIGSYNETLQTAVDWVKVINTQHFRKDDLTFFDDLGEII